VSHSDCPYPNSISNLFIIGPPATHPDSSFELDDGTRVTVAQYYEQQARINPVYGAYLPNGRLRHPHLPLVQVGSAKKPVYIPAELVSIIPGQPRQQNLPPEIASNLIKYAALTPNDRFHALSTDSAKNGLFGELSVDQNATAFGLSNISTVPMKVQGYILPPPKLQYGNRVIEPELKGAWNLAGGVTFAQPAPSQNPREPYPYGIAVVFNRSEPNNADSLIRDFQRKMEGEGPAVGIPLRMCTQNYLIVEGNRNDLGRAMQDLKNRGARFVLVLLYSDCYSLVKLAADSICLPTQCVRWQNLTRPPKNYHNSLLVKINSKMGGVNHTLASRAPRHEQNRPSDSFQFPPKSISWLFDEPCMVMVSNKEFVSIGNFYSVFSL
jgi:hypothetical protein